MSNTRPITILIVDDDEDDLFFAQRALEKSHLPSKTYAAKNGLEMMDYLRREGPYTEETAPMPDLILLDLNMPKKNGNEALEEIRQDDALKHIPVILFTTSDAQQDIIASYRLGANSYIKKPVDFDGMVRIMSMLKTYWMQSASLPPRILLSE